MRAFALVLLAAVASSGPLTFTLRVHGETELSATISGPAADLPPGAFRGTIAMNGSPSEMPVAGTVGHAGGRWTLPVVVRYADVPADWAEHFRPDTFTYRLRGASTGGAPREWTGTLPWKDVAVESDKESGAEFLQLETVRLTEMSLLSSAAEAILAVRNPFSFPLKIAESEYALSVNGREVGEGSTRGLLLHPAQKSVLSLPIEIDHAGLISAAGQALLSGGEIAAKLHGRLVVRLKGGDLTVPLDLSGHLASP